MKYESRYMHNMIFLPWHKSGIFDNENVTRKCNTKILSVFWYFYNIHYETGAFYLMIQVDINVILSYNNKDKKKLMPTCITKWKTPNIIIMVKILTFIYYIENIPFIYKLILVGCYENKKTSVIKNIKISVWDFRFKIKCPAILFRIFPLVYDYHIVTFFFKCSQFHLIQNFFKMCQEHITTRQNDV